MIRLGWKRFLALGLALLVLSTPFGLDGVGIAFFLVGLASIVGLMSGARHYRPHHAVAWYLLAASVALFLAGGLAAEIFPPDAGDTAAYPGWQEPFDLIGYVGCAVAVGSMARARQASRDRTITLDAAISMGGVGALAWATVMSSYLHSQELTALGKATGMAFTIVSLALGFVTVRVAIGPGARPIAYRLLSLAAAGAFAAEVALEIELSGEARIPGSELFSTLISATAVLLVAAAALHPTMASLTLPPTEVMPRVTRRRLVAMTVAVLIPPVLLVAEPTRRRNLESVAIIAVWAVLSAMVMLRIYSLARVREHVADLDQALAGAEASLAAATDMAQMADAVVDGAMALIGPFRWAAVHTWDDGWHPVARRGPAGEPVATAPPIGPGDDWTWRHGDAVLDLHLSAGEMEAGVVTIACSAPPDPLEMGRVARLVDDLARALESAALREDLVRERSERRFRALVERSADIVMVVDGNHVIRFVSPAGPRLLRRPEHEIVGRSYAELVDPDHLERFWGLVERPGQETAELQLVAGDGPSRWFEISAGDWRDEPEIRGIVITASEISGRKQAQLDLERSEARFRSLVQHASDLVAVLDASGIVSWVSPSVTRVLGRSQAEVVDRSAVDLAHPGDRVALADLLCRIAERGVPGANSVDLRLEQAGGGWRTLEVTVTNLLGEASVEGIVFNAHDVTDRRNLEQSLRHQALHDDLTGLPNRVLLRQRTEEAALRSGRDLAMLVIDLDDFKTINDGLGHSIGDNLLRQVSARLSAALRPDDVAARLGGDEFAVLMEGTDRAAVMTTAQRLLRAIEEPMTVSGREIALHASIGVAFVADTDPGTVGAETMLRSADLAMYGAKSRGKGRVAVFDESMHEGAFERLELKADLARALERDELRLHYQPVIDLARGTIAGFEALMRWEHHARGMVGPGTFIPLAEETGLIVPIGRWLMNEALGQLRCWIDRFPASGPLSMSINLSGRQLEEESVVGDLSAALDRAGVPASAVVVELTEGIMVDDSPVLVRRLEEIRALGVGLHADDFGTGFASYAALQSLPFTGVKIDRSLVSGLDGASADRAEAQIRSIISMAATTGLRVVAEGIESGAQAAVLRTLRCDHAQGFYFARPVPAAEAEAEMHRRAATGGSVLT